MLTLLLVVLIVGNTACAPFPRHFPGFRRSAWFDEQVRERWLDDGVRVIANAPDPSIRANRRDWSSTPRRTATRIEQTLGCGSPTASTGTSTFSTSPPRSAALARCRRNENIVLALHRGGRSELAGLEAEVHRRPGPHRKVVETLRELGSRRHRTVALTGHSGGGSFLFGFSTRATRSPTSSSASSSSTPTTATATPTSTATSCSRG